MQEEGKLYRIYNNIRGMLARRGCEVKTPVLSEVDLVRRLGAAEYVTIVASRGDDPRGAGDVCAVMFAPNSKYSSRVPEFQKRLDDVAKTGCVNAVFVADTEASKHISNRVAETNTDKLQIEYHLYKHFVIDVTAHALVPPHSLPPAAEVEEYCRRVGTTPDRFPQIRCATDAQAIWLGARPGMVIKVMRASEVGVAVVYRYCK
jgi:DNA-directed RNA polymerase subunit H (RpoH/RPB5)